MDRFDVRIHQVHFGHLCCLSGLSVAISLLTLMILG